MTAYFDSMDAELRKIKNASQTPQDLLRAWEERLVADCTIAVYFPGMGDLGPLPEDFKEAVNRCVVEHGVYTVPDAVIPDIETRHDLFRRLERLSYELHSVFHRVTEETGRSNTPTAILTYLVNLGYDDRDQMVAKSGETE